MCLNLIATAVLPPHAQTTLSMWWKPSPQVPVLILHNFFISSRTFGHRWDLVPPRRVTSPLDQIADQHKHVTLWNYTLSWEEVGQQGTKIRTCGHENSKDCSFWSIWTEMGHWCLLCSSLEKTQNIVWFENGISEVQKVASWLCARS